MRSISFPCSQQKPPKPLHLPSPLWFAVGQASGQEASELCWEISSAQTIIIFGMPIPRYQRSSLQIPRIFGDTWCSVTIRIVTTWVKWPRRCWCSWGERRQKWWNWPQAWQMKLAKWRKPVGLISYFILEVLLSNCQQLSGTNVLDPTRILGIGLELARNWSQWG